MSQWPTPNVTFSFLPDGSSLFGQPSNLFALYDAKYPHDVWQNEFFHALQCWQNASALTFTLVNNGQIKFGASLAVNGLDHVIYPPSGLSGLNGQAALNIGSNPDLFSVLLHVIGIAIGMAEGQPGDSVLNGVGPFTDIYPLDASVSASMYGPAPVPDNRPPLWTAPPQPPIPPLTLTAKPLGNGKIQLNWTPHPEATIYEVFRNNVLVKADVAPFLTWTDKNLIPGATYKYMIRAVVLQGPAVMVKA